MEWIERLNASLNYIEEHLSEVIEIDDLAQIACCSSYHYQRMFTYIAGIPLSEYLRRRRMSIAAVELQQSEIKIIDLALKYGYNSPTAFNRAFQSVHGIAPSAVRKAGSVVKTFPPISFRITVKGVEEMNYRIEKKEAFRIVGLSAPMKNNTEENFSIVPQLWGKAAQEGFIPKLASMMNTSIMGILGVSACFDNEQWKYFISVATSLPAEAPLEEYTVPAYTWAIFSGEGACPQAIQELERRIVTEWLPTSGYEYDNGPDIEVYLEPDPSKARFEVWIPVVRAKSSDAQ
ncbi:AraC family transcriptional regulator [Holdemania massiliensis]|uniref:Helix-turn-helix domain-containing protein n=1 Tax=Holdemania massiliensis TaxID=1468449 RepID=A0A6N7SCG8_9FIRM|nr:AraC family transcriptional regulator [Holdemania massiliensis]MSA73179.1 helix-turn-helix domain-containing protein [Holdemania massiliensis]MSA91352.1 helix-turn-helix domain-containing protein [Holdemania massiliensis]MSB80208.1 helix-turn-helix domain-containing protein [Holdemania massiliensis]MSC35129.1 helix-turn-helix domain-containing protein [Holdemania massiliensis]MSC41518.1 helix-turn-helix domain-containing protein [Holdemania massiliensis]